MLFPSVDEIQQKFNKSIDAILEIGKSIPRWSELQEKNNDMLKVLGSNNESVNVSSKSSKSNTIC